MEKAVRKSGWVGNASSLGGSPRFQGPFELLCLGFSRRDDISANPFGLRTFRINLVKLFCVRVYLSNEKRFRYCSLLPIFRHFLPVGPVSLGADLFEFAKAILFLRV